MSKNTLLIVESPSKCAKIEEYLGPGYQCISSKGHFREIASLSDIDTKHSFHPTYTLIEEKADHVAKIRKIIAKYSPKNILLATDDDREGEAIAWHICDEFGLSVNTTPRIVFHEITKPAIQQAVQEPRSLNLSLVAAAKARQVLDMIVGYKLSPLLWRNVASSKKSALSAGRCQTPALRLVHDNDVLLKSHDKNMIWHVHGHFFPNSIRFRLNHVFATLESVQDFLLKSADFAHTLSIDATKPSTQSAPKPLTTSRLLQQSGLSPKTTMELCQTLYQSGLITYMRTDSAKYSPVFLDSAKQWIDKTYGAGFIGDLSSLEQKDATQPHEAIRVTNLAQKHLQHENASLSRLYSLIWKHTVQSCMSAATSKKTAVHVSAPDEKQYEYVVETPVHLGWKKLSETEPASSQETALFYFQSWNGAKAVPWTKIDTELALESRLSHYTEASLINELEKRGIGRPSTFASIVTTIVERGYVKKTDVAGKEVECIEPYLEGGSRPLKTRSFKKVFGQEKGKLVLQPIGSLVLAFLLEHFDSVFAYDYTESLEHALDQIAAMPPSESAVMWPKVCQDCLQDLTQQMEPLKRAKKQTFALQDPHYELVFSSYGASICHRTESGEKEYFSVDPEREIDLEKAKRGEYSADELIWNTHLGVLEGNNVELKTGKYGLYAECNKKTVSLKSLGKGIKEIRMEDVAPLFQVAAAPPVSKSVLKELTPHLSIRKGKYGAYVFHQTPAMEKPAFYPLKEMTKKWDQVDTATLIQWIHTNHSLSIRTESNR